MSTPAGWYPDPSPADPTRRRLRWWDGAAWTEHVHTSPHAAAQQPSAGPSLTKGPDRGSSNPYAPPHQQGHQQPYQPSPYEQANQYPQYPPSQYPAPGVKAIATPDGQALAGLGFRLLARLVDGLLVTLIAMAAGWSSLQTMSTLYSGAIDDAVRGDSGAIFDLVDNPNFAQSSQTLTVIVLAVSAAYTILSLRFYGATPGKALCRIRVRDWNRPGLPGWGQAVVRWITSDLLGQIFIVWYLVDFLWPCWDQRRQALHDKMARTVVVRK